MAELTLYNTMARQKQIFAPLDPSNVRLYLCGPTVYSDIHIGNSRPLIIFDILYRLLQRVYGQAHVTYVRNLTDVDDKINQRASELKIPIRQLTDETIAKFRHVTGALHLLSPTHEPRATDHIEGMISIITALIEKGHAYAASGHALFHVPSMKTYGKLSRRSTDDLIAGARVEVAPYKKDPMDFVLWKPSSDGEPGWESPWGFGRPGWHIECSAMSKAYLGEIFDIHGGGLDLIFPHHENEIAQSCCAHGTDQMAQIWMHNGMLQVEGEKMSKSLGNFIIPHDLLQDWPGEVIRLAMISTHYRQPINWTLANLQAAQATLDDWYQALDDQAFGSDMGEDETIDQELFNALSDDLNTPLAISRLHKLRQEAQSGDVEAQITFQNSGQLLGLFHHHPDDWQKMKITKLSLTPNEIEEMIMARNQARAVKDFAKADQIRDDLLNKGIQIKDGPDGTNWSAI